MHPWIKKIPLWAWCFFAAAFLLHPQSPLRQGKFLDTDDYLYLVQTLDLVRGQSWFDVIQHRINPPEGMPSHFSPLLCGLYALPILALAPFLGVMQAAYVIAALFPLLFFAGLLVVVSWASAPFVGKEWAPIAAGLTLSLFGLVIQFMPGRLDHHGLEALLGLLAFGFIARMLEEGAGTRPAIAAGLLLAFALAIGLEILPVLGVMSVAVGLWGLWGDAARARRTQSFGLALGLGAATCLIATRPFSAWPDARLDTYAYPYVLMVGVISGCLALVCQLRNRHVAPLSALIVTLGVGLLAGAFFLLCFPHFLEGPYGGADSKVVALIIRHASEAKPLLHGGPYIRSLFLVIFALIAAVDLCRKVESAHRAAAGLLAFLIITTLALAIFYQQRFMVFAEVFSVPALTWGLHRLWLKAGQAGDPFTIGAARCGAVLLLGPLTVVLLPILLGAMTYNQMPLLWTVPVYTSPCREAGLFKTLQTRYADHPRTIMNTLSPSAEILLRTPHKVIAAPFHRNTAGNIDSYAFFTTGDESEARRLIRQRDADLVLLCKASDAIYQTEAGKNDAAMINRLIKGWHPDWLRPVEAPDVNEALLFEVVKDRL